MSDILTFGEGPSPEEREEADREVTGRWRCIGCGKFLRAARGWNQCADCDTREPEEQV